MSNPPRGYPGIVPCLIYANPAAAADWLTQVLGFRESPPPGGRPGGDAGQVEMERDGAVLVLGRSDGLCRGTRSHTRVAVDDVDDACLRALSAGGVVEHDPDSTATGAGRVVISDPEGNRWELVDRVRRPPTSERRAPSLRDAPLSPSWSGSRVGGRDHSATRSTPR